MIANDVSALDKLFWKRPLTLRFGVAEDLFGHDAIAVFRVGRPILDMTRRITGYWPGFATANPESQRVGGRSLEPRLAAPRGGSWDSAAHVSLLPPALGCAAVHIRVSYGPACDEFARTD